jgi:hypothetical protein
LDGVLTRNWMIMKPTVTRLAVTAVLLLVGSVAVSAQQPGRVPRVGVLRRGNPPPGDFGHREAFEGGLRDLGWTPGPTSSSSTGSPKANLNACPNWQPSWFASP